MATSDKFSSVVAQIHIDLSRKKKGGKTLDFAT
jgi:hypothetical protein